MTDLIPYITDLTDYSAAVVGDLFTKNIVQVVKTDGTTPVSIAHSFYGINSDDDTFPLAQFTVNETATGSSMGSISFGTYNAAGESTALLDIGENGMTVSGGLSVTGGSTNFQTSVIEVADIDIVLANTAEVKADLDSGGLILGTVDSGEIKLLYDLSGDTWKSSVGVNVDAGYSFTVDGDAVVLDETGLIIGDLVSLGSTGLTISDIVLSTSDGLKIGEDISITTEGLVLGATGAVILDTTGLQVGDEILLTVAEGLSIGAVDPVILNTTGLVVGDVSLSTTDGLALGDDVSLTTTSLTIGNSTGADAVVVNEDGITLGSLGSFTKSGGLSLGETLSIGTDSISFGDVEADKTTLDDTSLTLGADILLNHDGLYITNTDSAIFMGAEKWKIQFNAVSESLEFSFLDSTTNSYVTRMEIKSSV